MVYRGMCDASAAEALDAEHFVVASDEVNTLLIYKRGQPDAVGAVPLAEFLGTTKESDLEGAALVGRRIYWISSHGRNKSGKVRPDRYRFFATDIVAGGGRPTVKAVAAPYRHLLDDLETAPSLKPFMLAEAASLAPDVRGGLNIEGLAAFPDGRLLIGFRNPVPDGKALLVPLDNPGELLSGKSARFGAPALLDLGGRGIRSIEYVGTSFLIVAGPSIDAGTFALFHWSGKAGDPPTAATNVDLADLTPEALFEIPHTGTVQVISDEGGVETDGVRCKDRPASQQAFRSIVIKPQ